MIQFQRCCTCGDCGVRGDPRLMFTFGGHPMEESQRETQIERPHADS